MKRAFSLILVIFMTFTLAVFPALAREYGKIENGEAHLLIIHDDTPVYNFPDNNPMSSKIIVRVGAGQRLKSSHYDDFPPFKWYYIDLYDGYVSSKDVESHTADYQLREVDAKGEPNGSPISYIDVNGNEQPVLCDVCHKCPLDREHRSMHDLFFVVRAKETAVHAEPRKNSPIVRTCYQSENLIVVGRFRNEFDELWLDLGNGYVLAEDTAFNFDKTAEEALNRIGQLPSLDRSLSDLEFAYENGEFIGKMLRCFLPGGLYDLKVVSLLGTPSKGNYFQGHMPKGYYFQSHNLIQQKTATGEELGNYFYGYVGALLGMRLNDLFRAASVAGGEGQALKCFVTPDNKLTEVDACDDLDDISNIKIGYENAKTTGSWSFNTPSFNTPDVKSEIQIHDVSAPSGTLPYGQSFNLRGTISSETNLTNVTADVYNSSGSSVAHYSVNPNKTVYNIYSDGLNFDSQFRFGTLLSGNYRYVVSATNAAGTKELINTSFSIGSAPQKLSVLRYEDCYVLVQCPYRTVNLYLNPTDTVNEASFGRGQAPKSHRRAIMSDGSTWYEVNVNHNGVETTLWLKYESDIGITDLSEPTPPSYNQPAQPEGNSPGWSAWSDTPAYSSDTLEVDTRQVVNVEGHTEYRYWRWTDGTEINWCKEYGESQTGKPFYEEYSEWSTVQSPVEAVATPYYQCGHYDSEHPSHKHVDHYNSVGGYPLWKRYCLNGNSGSMYRYYWEETRWVDTTYKTQYRTRTIEKPLTKRLRFVLYDGMIWGDVSGLTCTEGQAYGELPTPTREGYTFDGWYTLETGGEKITASSIFRNASLPSGGETFADLFGHWTPIPPKIFTVSFDASGGFVDPTSITVTEKETYGSLPTPVRTDYTFDGWFTSSSGGSLITSSTSVNLSGPQTLYAHWTKIPVKTYTVSFNPQGGSVSSSSKTVTNGETYGTLPIPVRDGYAFDGWFTGASSQITSSTIVSLSGNQELQAHWTRVEIVTQKVEPVVRFVDVPETSFCFDAVRWAVESGVTKGTTATTFSPQADCSTAHIITFLWRAKGCPEPSISNPFSDLNPESYFAKAAIWAFEKGLVSGNIFNGGKPCTRARTVVFLWILSGKPIEGNSSFSDVPQIADYAYAVTWAVNRNITKGTTETTFSPERICTRGHIVTFLQRYFD